MGTVMTTHVEVVGAYGRTYKTLKEMKADWNADMDFRTTTGRYANKSDAERYDVKVVGRYGKQNEKVGTLR